MIEIATSKLSSRKKVLIDGHDYTVRKLSAGDELAISQILRKLNRLQEKAKAGIFSAKEEEEFNALQEQSLKIYADTFDDGGDGTKSLELISRLSYDERTEVYDMIFNADKLKEQEGEQDSTN
ncbi:hypothetical protein MPC38_06775 [Prescottella equi]|uniref:hypothetical protein n=1 Tax=Rhodococcus hoagii TaxID=43767 RepID=UPI001F5B6CB3|nr:hypothetical protein [Prescottella equi]UNQ40949.1 hypothetical protein MPC38_06775 [Prescottella equi]